MSTSKTRVTAGSAFRFPERSIATFACECNHVDDEVLRPLAVPQRSTVAFRFLWRSAGGVGVLLCLDAAGRVGALEISVTLRSTNFRASQTLRITNRGTSLSNPCAPASRFASRKLLHRRCQQSGECCNAQCQSLAASASSARRSLGRCLAGGEPRPPPGDRDSRGGHRGMPAPRQRAGRQLPRRSTDLDSGRESSRIPLAIRWSARPAHHSTGPLPAHNPQAEGREAQTAPAYIPAGETRQSAGVVS